MGWAGLRARWMEGLWRVGWQSSFTAYGGTCPGCMHSSLTLHFSSRCRVNCPPGKQAGDRRQCHQQAAMAQCSSSCPFKCFEDAVAHPPHTVLLLYCCTGSPAPRASSTSWAWRPSSRAQATQPTQVWWFEWVFLMSRGVRVCWYKRDAAVGVTLLVCLRVLMSNGWCNNQFGSNRQHCGNMLLGGCNSRQCALPAYFPGA
jgi:hypothetical protein